MARIARVVVPGVPHHVIQRGNRGMDVFFSNADRAAYLEELRVMGEKYGVAFWGYCLMSNHVHLIVVPERADSLARGIGWAHWRYTRRVNFRESCRGYLWQGRFYSCPMDERHAGLALRYVELNPVRAGLVKRASQWRWSSARAHTWGKRDMLLSSVPFVSVGREWSRFLGAGSNEDEMNRLRRQTQTGRPYGEESFVSKLERRLRRTLHRMKPGPKRKRREMAR